jgi:quinol monooxygenase YgiN
MAIRQVVTFRIKPGRAAAFMEGFAPIIEKVRAEQGCEQYDLFAKVGDPNTMIMIERWHDLTALEAALVHNYKGPNEPGSHFIENLAGPPTRERFEIADH